VRAKTTDLVFDDAESISCFCAQAVDLGMKFSTQGVQIHTDGLSDSLKVGLGEYGFRFRLSRPFSSYGLAGLWLRLCGQPARRPVV